MNSHLPVGRLAGYLEALSREKIWLAIVAATWALAALDHAVPTVGFARLYMPIICGSAWGLGAREGYSVAVFAAILAVMPGLQVGPPTGPSIFGPIAEGQSFAQDIHARLRTVLAGPPYPVTCSMGAVLIPSDAPRNADELMHLAGQATYRARQTGKNAVEIARAGDPPALRPVLATACLRKGRT